jgi:hypothetical protein
MQYSVVKKVDLYDNLRIDAEFYSPGYLSLEKLIKTHNYRYLKNFCSYIKKGIFDLAPDYYRKSGIPLIRTSEIKNPLIDFSTTVFIEKETQEEHKKTELTSGDIVFTKIGAYIGDVAILTYYQ